MGRKEFEVSIPISFPKEAHNLCKAKADQFAQGRQNLDCRARHSNDTAGVPRRTEYETRKNSRWRYFSDISKVPDLNPVLGGQIPRMSALAWCRATCPAFEET